MAEVCTYLNFYGNTEDAFNFYRTVFGGDFTSLIRFKDIPGGEKMSLEDQNKIMHVALPIGNSSIIMATDLLESVGQKITHANNYHISIMAKSEEEARKLFDALSEGGKITKPLEKTFWNAYFGMFNDKFGIQWMVNYDYKA